MATSQSRKPVVVLTMGAWHTPIHYAALVEELRSRGFRVVVAAGPGWSGTIPPNTKLQDDVDHFRAILLSYLNAGDDVTVVMHSFGGVIGIHGTLGLGPEEIKTQPSKPSGRIRSLVFLSAFPPPFEGELEDLRSTYSFPWITADIPNLVTSIDPEHARNGLYHDLTTEKQDWAISQLKPFPLMHFEEAKACTAPRYPAYTTVPTTYVVCDGDKQVPLAAHHMMIARVKRQLGVDFKQVQLTSSHSCMISMPAAVADIVENSC